MGRSPYQSEKRRKELARLKKQEEKRQRRFNKKNEGEGTGSTDGVQPEDGASPEVQPAEGQPVEGTPSETPPVSSENPPTA